MSAEPGRGPEIAEHVPGSSVPAWRAWLHRRRALLAIGVGALSIRLYSVLIANPTCPGDPEAAARGCFRLSGDPWYFFQQAKSLAAGQWFTTPFPTGGAVEPGAQDPPVFTLFLALLHRLAIDTPTGQRVVTSVLGAAGVVMIGILAERIWSPRAGLIAAALAALYAMLWINDGALMGEAIYAPLTALMFMAAYHFLDAPSVGSAVVVGLCVALAALTRPEALLFFPVLIVPLVLLTRPLDMRRRIALGAVACAAGLALIAPWVIFNLGRFERPVLLTSGTGVVISCSYSDESASGSRIGLYRFSTCTRTDPGRAPLRRRPVDESVLDAQVMQQGLEYFSDNLGRMPLLVVVRVGRMWDFYRPLENVKYNDDVWRRGRAASLIGLFSYYALLVPAVAGGVLMRRRGIALLPLISAFVVVTLTAALTAAMVRYRVPADVALVVLAAVGLDGLIETLRSPRSPPPAER